jgi:hypothetical protein
LLLVGSLIDWIPFIGGLGTLCIIIGVILVILGRKAFGSEHRRNVVISILLYIVGLVVIFAAVVVVFVTAVTGLPQGATRQQIAAALQPAITNSLYIVVAGGSSSAWRVSSSPTPSRRPKAASSCGPRTAQRLGS